MWQGFKNIYHLFVAVLAALWYLFPSKKLIVIGVTGTDGKTTTVSLIHHILKAAGHDSSMISSVGAEIHGKKYDLDFHVTTPSPWQIQKFLKLASSPRDSSLEKPFMVLEVTSHAIDQHRIWGIDFEVASLTNITHEHLDYHKTYQNYVKTKAKLLKKAKIAIVNKDDESYKVISSKLKVKSSKLITYGMGKDADITPEKFPFETQMMGEFNQYNCMAGVAVCKTLGLSDEQIREGLRTFRPPVGRTEMVYKGSFSVMVDFAHTPNAFEQLLSSLRKKVKGRIIHVFGSAGKRDSAKRPLMGKISSKYADIVVLTAEDPRGEKVDKIMDEIQNGIQKKKFLRIADRNEAITQAIHFARKGDLVLLTGKAHEKSMNLGRGEEPWDEFAVASEAIQKRK